MNKLGFRILVLSFLVYTLHFTLYALVFGAGFSAKISLATGQVEVKIGGETTWKKAEKDLTLNEKDEIRTGAGGRVVLLLSNGGRISLQENSNLALNELQENSVQVAMNAGTMNVKVKKMGAIGKFQVGTPASVCAVRGTNFTISAGERDTGVECYRGSVSVKKSGSLEETTLSRWQKIQVSQDKPLGSAVAMNKEEKNIVLAPVINELNQEVRMGMSREAVQAAAAQEIKKAEYQQGKSLIDAFGKRVRLEEYIVRPEANSFKMVVLTERQNRFDYMTWKATFNDPLPTDLRDATKWLDESTWGSTQPTYWLTKNESAISNTVDVMEWKYTDGHVASVGGTWKHFFDNYRWEISNANGTFEKIRWTGNDLNSYNNRVWRLSGDLTTTYTETLFKNWLVSELGKPGNMIEPTSAKDKLYYKYGVTFPVNKKYSEEYYIVDNDGKLLTTEDIVDLTTGNFKNYEWNEEMVFKADEFIGPDGKIDLVIEPKIFADAGIGIPSD